MNIIYYIICLLGCSMSDHGCPMDLEKPDGPSAQKIIRAITNYQKIEVCCFDGEERSVRLTNKDEKKIAEILKKTKYRKPVMMCYYVLSVDYIIYIKIIAEQYDDNIDVGINYNGDIPGHFHYDIPEEFKEDFRKTLKPYIENVMPEKEKEMLMRHEKCLEGYL